MRDAPKGDPRRIFPPSRSWPSQSIGPAVPLMSLRLIFSRQVVDGGEHHVRLPALAYPESVLDPAKVKSLIAARL